MTTWLGDPSLVVLAGALALDALAGEPPDRLHPVVWIGRTIGWLTAHAPQRGPIAQLAAGLAIAIAVPAAFTAAAVALTVWAGGSIVATVIAIWVLKSMFAARALGDAGRAVRDPLAHGDLAAARFALRSLCSRDPGRLDERQLAAATVESLAENASDSVVAPLCFYALFGLPGAVCYRAVNTLDAMIGYRGKYEHLGKAAARLDDALNLIPARITAGLLLVAGAVCGADVRGGWRILVRDGGATASPNAGRPMATMAGLLGVRLDKPGHYQLGDDLAPVTPATIDRAWRIVAVALAGAAALCAIAVAARAVRW